MTDQPAPYDYADLMNDISRIETATQAKVFRLGTVARRNALPRPYRDTVNAGLEARERVVATAAGPVLLRVEGAGYVRDAADVAPFFLTPELTRFLAAQAESVAS